jgi:4-hydroxy-tetrahydrodipicolinate synthase
MIEKSSQVGVYAPVLTPFTAELAPNVDQFVEHCRWLVRHHCGLVVFGTTSEANSLSLDEKIVLLESLTEADNDPGRMMVGTGACAFPDAVRLTRHALERGCSDVLMLPPFFYKDVDDEGLFRAFATVIDGVADPRLRVFLYHIPPVSGVPIRLALIERLLKAYPQTVVGIKDSSGDWSNSEAVLKAFPDLQFYIGSETGLLETMRCGGAGCIAATVNVDPAGIHALYAKWQTPDADTLQSTVSAFRIAMRRFPLIPALKETLACHTGHAEWRHIRPPLVELSATERSALHAELDALSFSLPGIDRA